MKIFFLATLIALVVGCSKDQTTILQNSEDSQGVLPATNAPSDGVSSGGGGDVVVCYNKRDEVIDMESYDIWTGPMHSRLTFTRPPVGENDNSADKQDTYMDQVNEVLGHLGTLDPVFAERLKKIAAEFSPEEIARKETINMVPAIALNGDAHAIVIPEATEKCHRLIQERMFWQVDNPRPHQYKYQLVERLWTKAPAAVRASVILHESIWKVERELFDPTTSANSQYFNAVINSVEFRSYTVQNYLTLISSLQYPITQGPPAVVAPGVTDDGQADLAVMEPATWGTSDAFSIRVKGAVFLASTVYFGTESDDFEVSGDLAYPQVLGSEKKTYEGYVVLKRDGEVRDEN
jgi:hypothetical protein